MVIRVSVVFLSMVSNFSFKIFPSFCSVLKTFILRFARRCFLSKSHFNSVVLVYGVSLRPILHLPCYRQRKLVILDFWYHPVILVHRLVIKSHDLLFTLHLFTSDVHTWEFLRALEKESKDTTDTNILKLRTHQLQLLQFILGKYLETCQRSLDKKYNYIIKCILIYKFQNLRISCRFTFGNYVYKQRKKKKKFRTDEY